MESLLERARQWIDDDPDAGTRAELQEVVESGDEHELAARMNTVLTFGTAGIRGRVGAGPGRMNRAVVIRTSHGLAQYLGPTAQPVIVGFDARPTSRQFAEDTAGVLAAAGIPVRYFPEFTPTPLVAYAAKRLGAAAAVVVTASHNPPEDNGYKVYGPDAAQIVPPIDEEIQRRIAAAPGAGEIARLDDVFAVGSPLLDTVPDDMVDAYWREVSAARRRIRGSALDVVYTPIHGVGRDVLFEVMGRAGHTGVRAVPAQAEPDGEFPTVAFPNPEEPGALDLALAMAKNTGADLVIANDPDADRLAVVVPHDGAWRSLSGNEVGALLADYVLGNPDLGDAAVVSSSIVSSPMLGRVATSYGAHHESTLTGFKWIVRAGMELERAGKGKFVFGYEEALGYTIGATVRDKDGISAALFFTDLAADLADDGRAVMDRLHELWRAHGLWVSSQTPVVHPGEDGTDKLRQAINGLADDPPEHVGDMAVTAVVDYRSGGDRRPPWLGEQDLIELRLADAGRVLVRPSGTEPKLKVYVDLVAPVTGDPDAQHRSLSSTADALGADVKRRLGV